MAKSISRAAVKVNWKGVTTIGIDVGDRMSQYCAIGAEGETIVESRVATTPGGFELLFKAIGGKTIAIETGTHSPWMSRLLRSLGHRVIVANSRKLRLIYENSRKDDRIDAQYLARLARMDPKLLSPVRHRSEAAQADLELIRSRDVLVATRTKLVNHVRGAIKPFGARLPRSRPATIGKKGAPLIPEALRGSLRPLLELITELSIRIDGYDREIRKLAEKKYPAAGTLMQVQGVGALTATAFLLTIDDPSRFKRSRSVGVWLGLTPAREDSGQSRPEKNISKEGDHYLRRLLVGSAQYILGPFGKDSDLRRHGLAMAARGGKNAKKRAVVAVARKLAVLLHRLWVTNGVYEKIRAERHSPLAA